MNSRQKKYRNINVKNRKSTFGISFFFSPSKTHKKHTNCCCCCCRSKTTTENTYFMAFLIYFIVLFVRMYCRWLVSSWRQQSRGGFSVCCRKDQRRSSDFATIETARTNWTDHAARQFPCIEASLPFVEVGCGRHFWTPVQPHCQPCSKYLWYYGGEFLLRFSMFDSKFRKFKQERNPSNTIRLVYINFPRRQRTFMWKPLFFHPLEKERKISLVIHLITLYKEPLFTLFTRHKYPSQQQKISLQKNQQTPQKKLFTRTSKNIKFNETRMKKRSH